MSTKTMQTMPTTRPLAGMPPPLRHRLATLSRIAAAVVGGYALAAVATAFLSLALTRLDLLARVDAALTATLLSMAVHAGATLWVFAAPTAGRGWAGVGAPVLVLGGLAWLMRGGGML